MTVPQFFATPGYGDTQLVNMHYSQALRIGDRVETSGQGGWDDEFTFPETLEDEIVRAFDKATEGRDGGLGPARRDDADHRRRTAGVPRSVSGAPA